MLCSQQACSSKLGTAPISDQMMVVFECWQVICHLEPTCSQSQMFNCAVLVHSRMCCACLLQGLAHLWRRSTQPSMPLSMTLSSTQECLKLLQCRESGCTEPCMLLPPDLLATMSGVQAFPCSLKVGSQGKTELPATSAKILTGIWVKLMTGAVQRPLQHMPPAALARILTAVGSGL